MRNNQEKIRFILAGLGFWGQNWMKKLTARDDCEIAAIVSIDQNELKDIRAKYGIPDSRCFTDFEKAIQQSNADAIVIVVPPDVHLAVIKAAVNRKLNILSEKPLASNMQEALEIGKILNKNPNLLFMVDQTRRWQAHIFALKNAIDNDKIGKIEQVIIIHLQAVDMGGYRAAFSCPVIDDMAIHQFDLVRYLTGKDPISVFADSYNPSWSWYKTKPSSLVHFEMTDGLRFDFFGSWVARGKLTSWEGDMLIIGEKGTLEVIGEKQIWFYPAEENEREKMEWEDKKRENIVIKPIEREQITHGLNEFIECLRKGKEPSTNFEDNIKSFAMVCAAAESSRLGKVVRVELVQKYKTRSF